MKEKKIEWKNRFFTPDEVAQMEAVFNERFFDNLKKDENISFEGYYEDEICYITLALKNQDESFYYPVETSISLKENHELDAEGARIALLDFIGSYFEDYFEENRETSIPIDWTLYKADDLTLYARGQVLNKKLENMADDILKSADKAKNPGGF
ncbi:MAG: hypothetical protein NTY22_06955 [Proteobacteria bacterium]|nr:hypothetical protein [Pseudomonadota bacterium]